MSKINMGIDPKEQMSCCPVDGASPKDSYALVNQTTGDIVFY